MIRALVLILPLVLGGCLSAADLEALAQDKNAVCINIIYPYGSVHFDRNWGCEAAPPAVVKAP